MFETIQVIFMLLIVAATLIIFALTVREYIRSRRRNKAYDEALKQDFQELDTTLKDMKRSFDKAIEHVKKKSSS